MGTPPKPDPLRFCPVCGDLMIRKRYNGRLEDRTRFLSRATCSQACGNTKDEVVKDTLHWRARKHRKPACEECAATTKLHVHHKDGSPANNDPGNLETLCDSCHLRKHWREDRPRRMTAAQRAQATAVARYGGSMRPRSTDGRWCSGG